MVSIMFFSLRVPYRGRVAFLLLALAAAGLAAILPAHGALPATPVISATSPNVISDFETLERVPLEKKTETYPVRLDFMVYFHDPSWKVAWGRCNGTDTYLTLGAIPFPVKAGQHILIEGTVVPAKGMIIEQAKYTPLAGLETILDALSTKGAIGETARFDKHLVVIEGMVEQQSLPDLTHMNVNLVSEGRKVILRLLLDGKAPPPELRGAQVRVRGVYAATFDPGGSAGALPKLELWVYDQRDIEIIAAPIRSDVNQGGQQYITSADDFFLIPEDRKMEAQPVRLDFLVYYHDPSWKVAWGRCAGADIYLTLGELPVAIKPGQRVLIEGSVLRRDFMAIDNPKITLMPDPPPLQYVPTEGRLGETDRFDKHLVTMEGYVDQQTVNDLTHLNVDLVSGGRAVSVRLLHDGQDAQPDLQGTRVRVKGVYSATVDPTGGLPKIVVWVTGRQNVEVVGSIARDDRFNVVATPIDALASAVPNKLVRVQGEVRLQQPGKSLTMRDETGQFTILTPQAQPLQIGDFIEAIGYPEQSGNGWQLREGLYRRAKSGAKGMASGKSVTLRLAEQVRELSSEEAARGHRVQLSGIITWASASANFMFVHDSSGGVCVFLRAAENAKIIVGAKVDITGASVAGSFTPAVQAAAVVVTARIDAPEAKQVTLEQTLTGVEDSQWVTMSGYIRAVIQEGPWAKFELTTSAGEFTARSNWDEQYLKLRGSVVRLRGVCSVITNVKRQLTGIQLWVPGAEFIFIEEAEPADLFTVGTRSIASLRQFNSLTALNRRVRVTGVVVHQIPGQVLHIQEGAESLLVLSRDSTALVPGDRVEVVGFPGREGNRVVLREAVYRRLAQGAEPVPQAIAGIDPIDVELDGRLVRIQALLLDSGTQGKNNRLVLQSKDVIFEALLDPQEKPVSANWIAGSRVGLDGVYQVEYDEYKRPHAVRFLLRSPQDIQILSRPSWLTMERALTAIGVLVVGLVLGFSWVFALRRRVRQQTGQISEQIESEKAARLEAALSRASKLESLGVLAGGIAHDFNNLLQVVLGNLSLAKLDAQIQADTLHCLSQSEKAARRAGDLTQQLITFAKGGKPVREVTKLAEVVREATQFALHGSKARSDFDFAADAWPADIDKGQIGQVVHNLIINAAQAMPAGGVIRIGLANEELAAGVRPSLAAGRYLQLTIADAGTGISPENLPKIFDPYFSTKTRGSGLGLASVYSIVKKHDGHVEVESKLGHGTTFHLWLPAASVGSSLPAAIAGNVPPIAVGLAPSVANRGRILVMDDEDPIRVITRALLERHGFDVTAVADGVDAVRDYGAAHNGDRPYELVILDLTVPGGMGGGETLERLRRIDPEVCAIVCSGYSNDPVMANYQAHGFRARVTKPYDLNDLVKIIQQLLPHRVAKLKPQPS